ncbi:MAG: response regulator [Endomicrobia bacterium]|nr:response regulator [Endomicrobiia bacterium]
MIEESQDFKKDASAKTILIIDDEDTIVDLFKYYISSQGFNVDIAKDGVGALEKIKSANKPDLIILDAMLPKKSGYEIIKILQLENIKIPIIVVTGRIRDIESQMMFKLEPNVKEFLLKPVQPDLLISKIHNILNTKPKEQINIEEKVKKFYENLDS